MNKFTEREQLKAELDKLTEDAQKFAAERYNLTKDIDEKMIAVRDSMYKLSRKIGDIDRAIGAYRKRSDNKRNVVLRVEFPHNNYMYSNEKGFYGWLMDNLCIYGMPVSVEHR